MLKIHESFPQFAEALQKGKAVSVDREGNWKVSRGIERFFQKLFRRDSSRLESVSRAFIRCLDSMERTALKFDQKTGRLPQEQEHEVNDCIKAALALKEKCKAYPTSLNRSIQEIDQKITALGYRTEILPPSPKSDVNMDEIYGLATKWKMGVSLYEGRRLTDEDKEKLAELKHYPEFVAFLKSNSRLQADFFKWTIRYNNPIRPFIEYPERCQRLSQVFLAQRVGRFAGKYLEIQKSPNESGELEKALTLPFYLRGEEYAREVRSVSVLNEKEVLTFSHGYQATLEKVFRCFSSKDIDPGDFEFSEELGIMNWHSHKHGWKKEEGKYDRVDYLSKRWWKQLPVFEVITKNDLEERYNLKLKRGEWLGVVKSTTESLELDVDKSHGYLEVAIPLKDKKYQILPFGKFADKYPKSAMDSVTFLANTFRSHIEYPDSNEFYSQRQQAAAPFVLTAEQGKTLMSEIQRTAIRSEQGNLIFQFAYENCAYWPQHVFEKVIPDCPDFFQEPVLSAKPSNPALGTVFHRIRKAPKWLQKPLVAALEIFLNPFRGVYVIQEGQLEKKTLAKTVFGKEQRMWNPGSLHLRIKSGIVKGIITFGHQLEKIHVSQ